MKRRLFPAVGRSEGGGRWGLPLVCLAMLVCLAGPAIAGWPRWPVPGSTTQPAEAAAGPKAGDTADEALLDANDAGLGQGPMAGSSVGNDEAAAAASDRHDAMPAGEGGASASQPAEAGALADGLVERLLPSADQVAARGGLLAITALLPLGLMLASAYVRIAVVLGLLRAGLGGAVVLPGGVLTGLTLLLTAVAMAPTLGVLHDEALQPYAEGRMDLQQAAEAAHGPMRAFMQRQVEAAGGHAEVEMFARELGYPAPTCWEDVPTQVLLPGFVLSELKTAFAIGIRLILPLVLIDLLVAGVLASLGLFLLPPLVVSIPLKLLLFVSADGWTLITTTLLGGFA